ncbi:hypothetical protein I2492_03355 [Budviciaceae bacterium CWB-B4]|uniref:MAE-28990/MAE-18760-like HEPN domain-containing protein n=1 Tax=Limnobaculum xujianqingii TaxID=2738837 RepID=A0A9D7AG38_9GAMM|nr:MAE_28990/MAE_18760 family HEPN-like nuclease [Limnobaculum xujianqingii]MBK5072056.1 hypothetical protein [Limnobaculum xujianqingii]MBK5175365.1 hypothetical protein [Limnobaculum xujianqingii]
MKIEQLESLLEEDLGWRKKELSSLTLIAEQHNDEVILKSIILLLYAHWEGYIKKSSKLYLRYISESRLSLNELTDNFKAVALKNIISQCFNSIDSLTLQNEITVINSFSEEKKKKFKVDIDIDNDFEKTFIDTQSNLNPKVFKNLLSIIGLNYKAQMKSKEIYIDKYLLSNRNLISHGGKYQNKEDTDFCLELNDIKKLRDIIFSIIDNFKEEIIEYAVNSFYLSSKEAECAVFLQKKEIDLERVFKEIDAKYQ